MVKKSKVILEGRNSNDQMSLLKIMPNLPKGSDSENSSDEPDDMISITGQKALQNIQIVSRDVVATFEEISEPVKIRFLQTL